MISAMDTRVQSCRDSRNRTHEHTLLSLDSLLTLLSTCTYMYTCFGLCAERTLISLSAVATFLNAVYRQVRCYALFHRDMSFRGRGRRG